MSRKLQFLDRLWFLVVMMAIAFILWRIWDHHIDGWELVGTIIGIVALFYARQEIKFIQKQEGVINQEKGGRS